jgi:hypothetical protein
MNNDGLDDAFIESEMKTVEANKRNSGHNDTMMLIRLIAMLGLLVFFTMLGE